MGLGCCVMLRFYVVICDGFFGFVEGVVVEVIVVVEVGFDW